MDAKDKVILHYVSLGYPDKKIAKAIGRTKSAVKHRLRNIYKKLRAKNRANAVYLFLSLEK